MNKQSVSDDNKRRASCPSCGASTTFEYLGTQKWPPAVAARNAGLRSVKLYQCRNCETTISEPNLGQ